MMKERRFLVGCGLVIGLLPLAGCDGVHDALYQDLVQQQAAAFAGRGGIRGRPSQLSLYADRVGRYVRRRTGDRKRPIPSHCAD
jgi:hypothetical protein